MAKKNKGMISFEVDLSDTFDEFIVTKEQARAMTEKVLHEVTNAFMFNWRSMAKNELGGSRKEYIRGIQRIDKGKLEKRVVLIGAFNNMLEMGANPFDMKKNFEKSAKKTIKTNGGWFLTIPFRFATPGSIGDSDVFAGLMPAEVYKIAKNLKATVTSADGKTSKKGTVIKLEDLPQSIQSVNTRKPVGKFTEYIHKSNIFEGIQRNEKTYEGATQSTYNSFRRVSDKSDPMSWIHSGIKARDLASKAFSKTNFNIIVDNSVDEYLSSNSINKR